MWPVSSDKWKVHLGLFFFILLSFFRFNCLEIGAFICCSHYQLAVNLLTSEQGSGDDWSAVLSLKNQNCWKNFSPSAKREEGREKKLESQLSADIFFWIQNITVCHPTHQLTTKNPSEDKQKWKRKKLQHSVHTHIVLIYTFYLLESNFCDFVKTCNPILQF